MNQDRCVRVINEGSRELSPSRLVQIKMGRVSTSQEGLVVSSCSKLTRSRRHPESARCLKQKIMWNHKANSDEIIHFPFP
jgi:hypothetical protein